MKLKDLTPNEKNPRRVKDSKLATLERSMREFGSLDGFVENRRSGKLISGHQRQKNFPEAEITVEREFDEPTAVGTVAEGWVNIEGERFPYRRVDWEEAKEKAAIIAANRNAGEWNLPDLKDMILDLDELNYDLDLTGFDEEERENLIVPVERVPPEGDPDHIPAAPKEPVARPGDLWILGDHRLLCGDSTVSTDVERLMGGELASVWSSDPPYGISYVDGVAQEKGQAMGYAPIANDELQDEKLKEFILACISASLPFMKKNFAFYMWHAMKMQAYFSQAAAAAAGILFHRQIIWVKPQFVFGRGQYHWRHELCLMGWMTGDEPPFYGERNQSTVWEIGRENDKIHPTQKPVALWEPAILNHTKPGEIVYEPFAGSGSNLIACEKTSRRCFAIEISPVYIDCIIRRWEEYTGQKAELMAQ